MNISTNIPKVSAKPTGAGASTPAKPAVLNKTNSAVPSTIPKHALESSALKKYYMFKRRIKFYELKQEMIQPLTAGEKYMYARLKKKLALAKKAAAPELIRLNMKKRAARGRGKRRGSDLAKLGSRSAR